MTKTNKLKGFIAECNKNQKYFADKINTSEKTFSAKVNEDSQFKEKEINIILVELSKLLGRPIKYDNVFLDRKYTEMEQRR